MLLITPRVRRSQSSGERGQFCSNAPVKCSCRSEIKVQSELDDAVRIKRCAADCAESSSVLRGSCWEIADGWVSYRFGKLWVIRQVENRSLKSQLGLLASRDLEIFLDVEVKIVCARIANV